jgi:hypothetical protein
MFDDRLTVHFLGCLVLFDFPNMLAGMNTVITRRLICGESTGWYVSPASFC